MHVEISQVKLLSWARSRLKIPPAAYFTINFYYTFSLKSYFETILHVCSPVMCFDAYFYFYFLRKKSQTLGLNLSGYCKVAVSDLCTYVSDSWEVRFATGRALKHIKRTKFYKRKKKLK